MAARYNLYYILREDMQKHPINKERSRQIRNNIEIFYRQQKPPDQIKFPEMQKRKEDEVEKWNNS